MWFNQYPYINLTDLNLDFIYKSIRELRYQLENFININTIKYADPIQWNITTQYEANTVVIDANDGTAYLSTKPVPSGVALTNTDYWTPIFTLNLLSANQNITLRDDGSNVLSTFASVAGDWLIWNNTLYRVTRAINVNEAYVVGYNIERYTVELFIKDYINAIDVIIGDLNDLTTTDKTSVVNAINEVNLLSDLSKIYVCETRADVANVDAPTGAYIVALNAYAGDGVISHYVVTNGVADGYFNVSMTNGNCAELVHGDTIHAHQVGAFPNGADCCGAINAIVDNLSDVTVKFGAGRYTFDDRLWLNSNQTIEGVGDDTILYISQDPVLNHGEFIGIIGASNDIKVNVTLKNFAIDVYVIAPTDPTEDVNPIGVVYAKHVIIENVHVLRSNWRGMQFEGGALEDISVINCTIENVYQNAISFMHVSGGSIKNVLVKNLKVKGFNAIAGVLVTTSDAAVAANMDNIVFENVSIDGTASTVRPVYLLRANNVTLKDFYIRNCLNNTNNVQLQVVKNIIIENLNNDVGSVASGGSGVALVGGCENVILKDLLLEHFNVGIAISTTVGANSNVIISDAIITNAGLNGVNNTDAALVGKGVAIVSNKTNYNASSSFTII